MHRGRDKIRCKECERDHHHDVTPAAALAGGNLVRACGRAIDDLLQPSAADRNGSHERRSGLGSDGADVLAAVRHDDLAAAARSRPLPADRQDRRGCGAIPLVVRVIDSIGGALRVGQKGDVQGRVPEHDPVHGSCDHSSVVEGVAAPDSARAELEGRLLRSHEQTRG